MSNVLLHSLQFSCSEMPIAQFSSILLQPALLPVHCSSQYYMYSHSNNRFTVHTTKSIHYQASLNTAYRCLVSVCDCFVCDSKSLLSLLSLNLVASSSFLVASSTTFRLNIPCIIIIMYYRTINCSRSFTCFSFRLSSFS